MQQRCKGVLNGKAESARKNSVWAREQIALVHKQDGTIVAGDRLTLSGVALVSMMKSSNLRNYYKYARVPASPRFSTLERPWPALNVSSNAGMAVRLRSDSETLDR